MSTKQENVLDLNSCLNRAAADEPIFVLRSSDPIAPDMLVMWAARYLQSKGGWQMMSPAQRQKHRDALACAESMHEYNRRPRGVAEGGLPYDDDIPF